MVNSKLLDQVRYAIRLKHFSLRTEQAYIHWIRRFILFHGKKHPTEMNEKEVGLFLTHLAVNKKVSASTQNQAFSAILFLYRHVLKTELGWLEGVERAKNRLGYLLFSRDGKLRPFLYVFRV
jgi:site-specific recombinase XerD